ncbi:MAG: CoA transferase [Azospirillaceae bacterium]
MAHGFLAGLRVLDLGQYVPGPYATLILGDLGAEVVKVEAPGGDPMRALGPAGQDGVAAGWRALNGGKTIVTLDLKDEAGQAAFAELLSGADVLVEAFRPGVLDRLGFPPDRLAALAPDLIHVAMTGWGASGPYRDRAGHDLTYMALGGGLALSGTGRAPDFAYPPISDYASGMQAAIAVLAALAGRGRKGAAGGGVKLDVSMAESVLAWQAWPLSEALGPDPTERRSHLLNGGAACYRLYQTAEGRHLAVAAIERKFWVAFCNAVDHPEWIPRHGEPMPQRDLIETVGAVIRKKPLADWWRLFRDIDCCVEPIWHPEEVVEHPQIAARGLVSAGETGVSVLTPLFVDGRPPGERSPPLEAAAAAIVEAWRRGTEASPAPAAPGSPGGRKKRSDAPAGPG